MPIFKGRTRKSLSQFDWVHQVSGDVVKADPLRADVMQRFLDAKREKNLAKATVRSYLSSLRTFEGFLGREFSGGSGLVYSQLEREDIDHYLKFLRSECRHSAASRRQALTGIKQFLRFAISNRMSGPFPEFIRDISVKLPRSDPTEKTISEAQFTQIIDAAATWPWFQSYLALVYDTGCRAGEAANCRVKDFRTDKQGGLIRVSGKTGPREIRTLYSTRYITEQINRLEDNPEGWLFPSPRTPIRQVGTSCIRDKFTVIRKKLGYKMGKDGKWPFSLHTFRHNRATIVAKCGWNEEMMRKHFGWCKGSDMPSHYTHVNRSALDAAIFKSQGASKLFVEEEEEFGIETTWDCKMCSGFNPMHHNFCGKCGQARSRGVAMTYDNILETIEKKVAGQIAEKALNEILADKELQELGNALQPDEALKEELGLT